VTGVTVILLALVTLPYVYAESQAGVTSVFGGFLLNPQDGNSYLAKMYLGWRGEWLFTLPYTAEKGQGVFLYFFYILLGHIARSLGTPLILAYHVARILSAGVMSLAIYRFAVAYLPGGHASRLAYVMACFGAGSGWLALPFNVVPSDFWVAEAYPFLSAYVNPHFPLSLALLLFLLLPIETTGLDRPGKFLRSAGIVLAAFALAVLSPFAVAIALVCWSGMALWELLQAYSRHSIARPQRYLYRLGWIALGGVPMVVYELAVTSSNSLLSGWSAQNLTPAPPLWDLVLSLSPWLLLVPFGMRSALSNGNAEERLLIVWCVASLALLYLPWSLQRRFMVGIYIPVITLSALALERLIKESRRYLLWGGLLFLLAMPTNLLVLQAGRHGILTRDANLYLSRDEAMAMDWIQTNTPADALILAAPETGLLIPARTGRRVIYGHPYETIQAEAQKLKVEHFFQGEQSPEMEALLARVDYVFYGPREREIGRNGILDSLSPAYENPSVVIYSVKR
jgi:hypothetical protein